MTVINDLISFMNPMCPQCFSKGVVKNGTCMMMCSLYCLDTYRREYILLEVDKGESRGEFTNLLFTPEEMVI